MKNMKHRLKAFPGCTGRNNRTIIGAENTNLSISALFTQNSLLSIVVKIRHYADNRITDSISLCNLQKSCRTTISPILKTSREEQFIG